MKKEILTILVIVLLSIKSIAQTPFTTLVKEPRLLEKKTNSNGKVFFGAVYDTLKIKNYFNDSSFDKTKFTESKKEELLFFKNNNLSLNLANEGENRLSLNSEIIHYKLYVANPNENNTYRYNKYNIPLLLISKISSSNDSITKSSAYDVLDYNGSPITLRIMPSIKTNFTTINDVIYFGVYSDLRGIQTNSEKLNLDYIWSNGIGLTYQGDSEGAKVNENGDYVQGKYSLSLMYQFATGNSELISSLFDTENNMAKSIQGIFIIKLGNDNPLNLRVGYQHFITPLLNGSKSNFSIALGI
jgi:hypothetical protein